MLKKNLIYILLFLVSIFLLIHFGLRAYTHHGEKLNLPDFIDQSLSQAIREAEKNPSESLLPILFFWWDGKEASSLIKIRKRTQRSKGIEKSMSPSQNTHPIK